MKKTQAADILYMCRRYMRERERERERERVFGCRASSILLNLLFLYFCSVVVLDDARLVEYDTPDALLRDPGSAFSALVRREQESANND